MKLMKHIYWFSSVSSLNGRMSYPSQQGSLPDRQKVQQFLGSIPSTHPDWFWGGSCLSKRSRRHLVLGLVFLCSCFAQRILFRSFRTGVRSPLWQELLFVNQCKILSRDSHLDKCSYPPLPTVWFNNIRHRQMFAIASRPWRDQGVRSLRGLALPSSAFPLRSPNFAWLSTSTVSKSISGSSS